MNKYFIKDGYIENTEGGLCDVTNQIADGTAASMQKEVYKKALEFPGTVLDIGTGCGYKLIKYFGSRETLGTEVHPNYEYLLNQYPNRRWRYSDFSKDYPYDIVICADVVEHIRDPDELMEFVRKVDPKYFVFSTPDRELLPEWCRRPDGPPLNHRHFREWTEEEFVQYLEHWFPEYCIDHKADEDNIIVWGKRREG